MTEHQASRTLVKSPPELWAECSDAESLSRHLDKVGEIRITRLEPENTVAWEGEEARGTVKLEPSGWGTRVTLTLEADDDPPPQEPDPKPAPNPLPPAAFTRRRGLLGRLLAAVTKQQPNVTRRAPAPLAPPEPDTPPPPLASPEPVTPPPPDPNPVLIGALDSLGTAHHRPFSRA